MNTSSFNQEEQKYKQYELEYRTNPNNKRNAELFCLQIIKMVDYLLSFKKALSTEDKEDVQQETVAILLQRYQKNKDKHFNKPYYMISLIIKEITGHNKKKIRYLNKIMNNDAMSYEYYMEQLETEYSTYCNDDEEI